MEAADCLSLGIPGNCILFLSLPNNETDELIPTEWPCLMSLLDRFIFSHPTPIAFFPCTRHRAKPNKFELIHSYVEGEKWAHIVCAKLTQMLRVTSYPSDLLQQF